MINVKTDVVIKKKAQGLAKELGLPLGTVINGYLRQFIADQRITVNHRRLLYAYLERFPPKSVH